MIYTDAVSTMQNHITDYKDKLSQGHMRLIQVLEGGC